MKTSILLLLILAACAPQYRERVADKPPYWGQRIEQPAPKNDPAFADKLLFGPFDEDKSSGVKIRRRHSE